MKAGDLVMPKDTFLRLRVGGPLDPEPGVLLERIYAPRRVAPGAHGSWHVLWRGEKHVMFDNEIVLLESSNV